MIRCLTVFLGMLIVSQPGSAQDPQELFSSANQLYQEGKLDEARAQYERILANGYESGSLYYNLGNVYYRLGNIPKAILNYERARKRIPNDEDLHHNLMLANLLLTDRVEPVPRLFIWDMWDDFKALVGVEGATWLSYVFFVVLNGAVGLILLSNTYRLRKLGAGIAVVCAVCLVLSITLLISKVSEVEGRDDAVVMAQVAVVKNEPDDRSTDAFVLHAGTRVWITERVHEWIKIRIADGKVGWMGSASVEVI